MRNRLAVVLLLSAAPLFAQARFDGTWEMKMDTLHFTGPPEKYLIEKGMYHCLSCVPPVDVKADGTDQKSAGHESFYDTVSVRIIDPYAVSFTFKKDGKLAASSIETVSTDNDTMTEDFSNSTEKDPVIGQATFTRVGPARLGSHALSGEWQMDTVHNSTKTGTLTTFESTDGGLKISDGIQTYAAKFDGIDYPIGRSGHGTIALKLIDEYTIEETDKRDGKLVTIARMTVAKDGKSMKVESTDKQRGTTMTYTAEKLK